MHVDHLRDVIGIEDRKTERLLEHRDQVAGVDEGAQDMGVRAGVDPRTGTKIRPVVGLIALPDLSSRIGVSSYQLSRSLIRTPFSDISADSGRRRRHEWPGVREDDDQQERKDRGGTATMIRQWARRCTCWAFGAPDAPGRPRDRAGRRSPAWRSTRPPRRSQASRRRSRRSTWPDAHSGWPANGSSRARPGPRSWRSPSSNQMRASTVRLTAPGCDIGRV